MREDKLLFKYLYFLSFVIIMKYDAHVLRLISFDLSNVRTNVLVMVKFSLLSYNCMDGSACHLCIHHLVHVLK